MKCSDPLLLSELLKQGDQEAFSKFYEQIWEKLFLYVLRIVKNKDDAMDIVQESFLAIWEKRESLISIRSIMPYVFGVARFKTIRFIKLNTQSRTCHDNMFKFISQFEYNLEENLIKNDLEKLIYMEINKLPTKMKEIFLLSRKDQLSYLEISKRLDISDKTVKKQINNAIKILKIKLVNIYLLLYLIILSI